MTYTVSGGTLNPTHSLTQHHVSGNNLCAKEFFGISLAARHHIIWQYLQQSNRCLITGGIQGGAIQPCLFLYSYDMANMATFLFDTVCEHVKNIQKTLNTWPEILHMIARKLSASWRFCLTLWPSAMLLDPAEGQLRSHPNACITVLAMPPHFLASGSASGPSSVVHTQCIISVSVMYIFRCRQ